MSENCRNRKVGVTSASLQLNVFSKGSRFPALLSNTQPLGFRSVCAAPGLWNDSNKWIILIWYVTVDLNVYFECLCRH